MRSYCYTGPVEILDLVDKEHVGTAISSPRDFLRWVEKTKQRLNSENQVVVTFVIDLNGKLLIADRHSEHVVCAGGAEVLSAGEMTINVDFGYVGVVEVTNQSTGYCPEPESWEHVKMALARADIGCPDSFTQCYVFRKCENCGLLNIVKDDWFVCVNCGDGLNANWNIC